MEPAAGGEPLPGRDDNTGSMGSTRPRRSPWGCLARTGVRAEIRRRFGRGAHDTKSRKFSWGGTKRAGFFRNEQTREKVLVNGVRQYHQARLGFELRKLEEKK